MELKLIKEAAMVLSSIRRKIDDFFITDRSKIKEMHRIRSLSYYYITGYILYLIGQLTNRMAPLMGHISLLCLMILRFALLKLKWLRVTLILESFLLAFYPLQYARPIENILNGSVFPLLFPIVLFFYMMPLRLILFILIVNLCIVIQLRSAALEIFASNDNILKMTMIYNLYNTIFFFMILAFIVLALCRLQYDGILKDRKNLNKELKAANIELNEINKKHKQSRQLLEAVNKELELSKHQLEEALKAKDLLATVSHELRNPLNSLIGNIELLLDEVTVEEQLQKLQVAKMCADTLLCLINNLLDAAKIASDKLEVSLAPASMYQLLEKLWRMSSAIIKNKNLVGELWISKNFPRYLMLDSHRIMQILMNLINNAVKFTEKGSIKIMISWVDKENISDSECLLDLNHSYLAGRGLQGFSHQSRLRSVANDTNPRTPFYTYSSNSLVDKNQKRNLPQRVQTQNENVPIIPDFNDDNQDKVNLITQRQQLHPRFIKDLRSEKLIFFNTNNFKITESIEKRVVVWNESNFSSQNKNGYLKIDIIDTGCGIAEERQSQLFTPFTREDESITRRYSGTGLGLYIIKNLIHKMKGEIIFFSEKNIGTHFVVQIPSEVVDNHKPEFGVLRNLSFMNLDISHVNLYKGNAVMIVEDNNYNQTVLKSFMAKFGLESHICDNGKQGYELYRSKPPGYFSFITMDLQMPVMDGITSSIMIREYEEKAKISISVPIVIVTANCSEFEKNLCLDPFGQIRASFFFRKPLIFADCLHFVPTIMASFHQNLKTTSRRTLISSS